MKIQLNIISQNGFTKHIACLFGKVDLVRASLRINFQVVHWLFNEAATKHTLANTVSVSLALSKTRIFVF